MWCGEESVLVQDISRMCNVMVSAVHILNITTITKASSSILSPLVRRQVVVELELISDLGPHVPALVHQTVKEWDQLHQFVV